MLLHQEGLAASSGHNGGGGKDTKPLIVHLLKQFPDVVAELLHSEDVAEFENVGASNLSVGEKEESKKTYLMKLNESSENISNKDRVERFSPHWYVRCRES